ncbi:MAG TPA: LysM peptidoglycan-binding domain-containing protein [Acidimicrobiales bacterium]|nr:LysM peptidoglycan-binding domain-containing protein [Acidimicrobiales bacterium]
MPLVRRSLAPLVALGLAASASTYVVQPGDTLSGIAARAGVSVVALADANGILDADRLLAGQTLRLPGSGGAAPAAATVHVVAPGETLTAIAHRYGTTVAAIAGANSLADPNVVRVGTPLQIPSAGGVSAGLPDRLRSSPRRLALIPHFQRWATANAIDPALVMAVAWHESGWQNDVISRAGAIGIGQLLPSTARWVSEDLIGVALDPRVPEDNIRMTARYLRWLLHRAGGDVDLALAGYFQGPVSVETRGLYPVTTEYLAIVQSLRPRFAAI